MNFPDLHFGDRKFILFATCKDISAILILWDPVSSYVGLWTAAVDSVEGLFEYSQLTLAKKGTILGDRTNGGLVILDGEEQFVWKVKETGKWVWNSYIVLGWPLTSGVATNANTSFFEF